jgi:protein-S-isoprenylcysteine O-methyltransferase Ste14
MKMINSRWFAGGLLTKFNLMVSVTSLTTNLKQGLIQMGGLNPLRTSPSQSLLSRLIRRSIASHLILAALLFLPAGSLQYWPGWGYLAVGLVSTIHYSLYFYQHDRQLLERRLLKKETVSEQKCIMTVWKVFAYLFLMLAGADYRFGWSCRLLGPVPWWLTVPALLLVLGGYTWVFQVFKANRFAASVIQVESSQAVIDTGPYRFVRHPLYAGSLCSWLCTPLALGSFVLIPVSFFILPILACRLLNEEKVLRRDLPGYVEYCQRTRYRLIPFVW